MRSGADFSDELGGTGGILGRGDAVVAGFEVDLAQLGLGGKVHTESAAGQVKAGIAPQDGHAVALTVVQIDGILPPHLVHRAEEEPGPAAGTLVGATPDSGVRAGSVRVPELLAQEMPHRQHR